MKWVYIFLALTPVFTWLRLQGFAAAMNYKRAWKTRPPHPAVKHQATPLGLLVALGDIHFNWTAGCVIFWEFPREFLMTTRCKRHERGPDGWRRFRAKRICEEILEPLDEGHCNMGPETRLP